MCGFIGKISYSNFDHNELIQPNELITCRGPDKTKTVSSFDGNINYSFIFNRLSILDLSETANQPMLSHDSETILMFNGEIYNHAELRSDLINKGLKFITSHSDTEVVLKGIMHYGLDFIKNLRGMFSIIYLDKKNKRMYMIRDRLGQKPLYYKFTKNEILFASNLKALLRLDSEKELDFQKVNSYIKLGIVSSPDTIFKNYFKVEPSEIIEIDYSSSEYKINKTIYWKPEDYLDNKKFLKEEFFNLFNESVGLRLEADVPVATFLSGGLDSSSIVKTLYDMGKEINTFSVTLDNKNYDESKWSNLVASQYNTQHKSVNISSKVSFSDIHNSLDSLDEPYADPSVVPSFLLSKEISSLFKVAISGDGGDELLGGYLRTRKTLQNKSKINQQISKLYNLYPAFLGTGNFFLSKSNDIGLSYNSFLEDNKLLKLLGLQEDVNDNSIEIDKSIDPYKSLLLADYRFYLPEMMMFKVDRTSMANSLEVRSPFVDHKLIEYMFSHNTDYFDHSASKKLLREFLLKDLGKEFTERRKKGFVFDIENTIYKNFNYFNEYINNGKLVELYNTKPINLLKINQSRINSHRIWKLFVIENYLSSI